MSGTMKSSPLADDLLDALDGELEKWELVRDALLRPYQARGEADLVVDSVDIDTKLPTKRRYPKTLGPPFALGAAPSADPLPALGGRLAKAGGRAAWLARVSRATAALGHLVVCYEQGLYAGRPLKDWRKEVAEHYEKVKTAILAAKAEIEAWEKTLPAHRPSSKVLKDEDLVFPEMIMEMLRIKIDAARKLVSSGAFGKPVRLGKRVAVFKKDMYEAMRAQAPEVAPAKEKPPGSPFTDLPRRRRRSAVRRAPKSDAAPEAPPATDVPPTPRAGPTPRPPRPKGGKRP